MLNHNEKTICQCCECHSSNIPKTKAEVCERPLTNCMLKYCNFDKVQKAGKASVDCIRMTDEGNLVLLEIKNQKSKNIEPDKLNNKLIDTTSYLKYYEADLLKLNKLFVLAIPEYKLEKEEATLSPYFVKIGEHLVYHTLSVFNGKIYKYTVDNESYDVFSKICICEDTDNICK